MLRPRLSHRAAFLFLFMKTCSKCKRELDESCFVKSSRYLDGLYPSCKDCRKAAREKTLGKSTLCVRCEASPRMKSTMYCSPCLREITSDDHLNKLCTLCEERKRKKCSDFCDSCAEEIKREYHNERSRQYRADPENRMKLLARSMLNYQVRLGNIQRLPCEVCGKSKTEGHHYMGYAKEYWLVVRWLCMIHHQGAERALKTKVDSHPAV